MVFVKRISPCCHTHALINQRLQYNSTHMIALTFGYPFLQVYGMLILVISIIVYTYVLPYKSKVANILEIVVQLNFLTLLVLETTPLFQETLFVFPATTEQDLERSSRECVDSPKNTSLLTWLLLPFYYLPVLGLILTASVYLALFLM